MTLLFSIQFVQMILAGAKTQTRRPSRPNVKEGGTYRLRAGIKPTDHWITVVRIYTQSLGDMSPEDVVSEGFKTLDEFKETWMGIYRSWVPQQTVYVVEFRLEGAHRNV